MVSDWLFTIYILRVQGCLDIPVYTIYIHSDTNRPFSQRQMILTNDNELFMNDIGKVADGDIS